MHHADAKCIGIVGILNGYLFSILLDHAFFRLVQAEKHTHQRGLACAVFTKQSMNFALAQLQGNVVVGHNARESLGNVEHFNGVLVFQEAYLPTGDPLQRCLGCPLPVREFNPQWSRNHFF